MHLQPVSAVLKCILDKLLFARKFAWLANGHKSSIQRKSHGGCEKVSTSFNPNHHIHRFVLIMLLQSIDHFPKTIFVFQKCRDVVEVDAWFREVRYFANQLLDVIHGVAEKKGET